MVSLALIIMISRGALLFNDFYHVFSLNFSFFFFVACVSSRPGQSGRCDGYILEGKELEFYQKKLRSKKAK